MPPVTTAAETTEIALAFVKKHRLFARPVSAKQGEGYWLVEVDVGLFDVKVGWVKIETSLGVIQEYSLPP